MTIDTIAALVGVILLMGAVLTAVGIGFWHEFRPQTEGDLK